VHPPRLLLVPSFTELEWGIRPALEDWAEVAAFDMPGVGTEPLPAGIEPDPSRAAELLSLWRGAGAKRGLEEVERRGWERFVVVTDSHGAPTAVRLARTRSGAVLGLAIGHASLSHASEGERAPMNRSIWEVMVQLAPQGGEAFVRHGIAQATRGGISEDVAQQMLERFPDMELVAATVEALGHDPEPIGDDLAKPRRAAAGQARRLPRPHRRGVRGHRGGVSRRPRSDLPGDLLLQPRVRRPPAGILRGIVSGTGADSHRTG
jgi:hypothetical protein